MDRNSWLAFAGGASIGLMAGRLLPPFVSQGIASLESARGKDWFDVLAGDHRDFSHLLAQMIQSRGRGTAYRAQLFLRLKRGLAAHATAEEDVIYPLLREEAGAEDAALRFYGEHGRIKTHLYALERLIGDEAAWIARAADLRMLVERHAREEEEVEFPRLRALMDEEEMKRVARHVRREKSMIL